jgi:hypothetical protein
MIISLFGRQFKNKREENGGGNWEKGGNPTGQIRNKTESNRNKTGKIRFETGKNRFESGPIRFKTGKNRFETGPIRFKTGRNCDLNPGRQQFSQLRLKNQCITDL